MNEEEVNNKEANVPESTLVDKVNLGNVHISKWSSENGISYSMSIGYRKNNEWINKRISIVEQEMPNVIKALKTIYNI